jgi:hypothetical protein
MIACLLAENFRKGQSTFVMIGKEQKAQAPRSALTSAGGPTIEVVL